MKIIRILICALTCFNAAFAQNSNKNIKAINTQAQSKTNNQGKQEVTTLQVPVNVQENISFNEDEYNFGKIPQGKPVTHIFLFKNTSNKPITLDNVQTSCGCTTPEWSKDLIAPGQTSKITVGYNAANEGAFTKFITVTYNSTQSKQINIKGEVWKTPETSVPENSALATLKNQQ